MSKLLAISLLALVIAGCSQSAEDAKTEAAADEAAAASQPVAGAATETPVSTASADEGTAAQAYSGAVPKPILVGTAGPQMDACGTFAKVARLDPQGDNFLSVRDAPSTSTKERDRLDPGQGVSVCASENGWSGVVYAKRGDAAQDCGTGSPVAKPRNYLGPCRQGWVDSRYLEMAAG